MNREPAGLALGRDPVLREAGRAELAGQRRRACPVADDLDLPLPFVDVLQVAVINRLVAQVDDGSFVTADLPTGGGAKQVIIPARAVSYGADSTWVFVARNGRMARQSVQLGDKLSEGIVVNSGLQDGDQIVLLSRNDLRSHDPSGR